MTLTTETATSKECTSCLTSIASFLHNVRHRGVYKRLCTSCVLRLHPASFCPSCFQLHDPTPPHPHKRITCSNCNSVTHSTCLLTHASPPSTPYLCPPCASPDFLFFEVDRIPEGVPRTVDKKSAVILLCATRIAAVSMGKAVIVARAEAERKVREAAVAGKRAKEALDHVAALAEARRKDESAAGIGSGSGVRKGESVEVKKEVGGWDLGNGNAGGVVKVENFENGNVLGPGIGN